MNKVLPVLMTAALCLPAAPQAATIYPLNNAEILSGGRFDIKVEFDSRLPDAGNPRLTINGKDAENLLGKKPLFVADENGKGSALLIRDAHLPAGTYTVEAKGGDESNSVTWKVFSTGKPQARNVILLIADGLSVGHRTAARLLSKGMTEGKYNGRLALDTMPHLAFVGTGSVDSIAADSANTMSAYTTGHKSSVNAIGVYADRTPDPFDDPKQETLGEVLRRTGKKSLGVVSDAELEDATPAAVVAHTRKRAEKAAIVEMFHKVRPDVLLGGGAAYFLPQSVPGSKRKDEINYIQKFKDDGYALVTSNKELQALPKDADRVLGLFHPGNMDGALDRKFLKKGSVGKFPDQPDLTDMARTALDVLSRNPEGFVLVLEAGLVDKYSHPLDWERAVYDTIMFDKVVALAREFCEKNPDTLLIVTGDHTHSISVAGTVDDRLPGTEMRAKVGTYGKAGYPLYEDKDGDGYPDSVNPPKRLAVFFGATPDYYETFAPKLDNPFVPAVKDENGRYVANAAYKNAPGAEFRPGVLPRDEAEGVHTVDDMLLHAQGPTAENFCGYLENTEVFKLMAQALGLGR